MPVPSHDLTCTTRATQMPCNHCGAAVWYFSCSCGSKVFFNELGWPWERHYCKEYFIRKTLEMLVDIDRMTNYEIYQSITRREKLSGMEVDDSIWDVIESVVGKRKSKLSTEIVEPEIGLTEVSGKVVAFNRPINIFSRLGYDSTTEMSAKLLGKLSNVTWAYTRIRTNPDRRNKCLEFEVLIDVRYLEKNPLRLHDTILGIAKGTLHSKGIVWVLVKHDTY